MKKETYLNEEHSYSNLYMIVFGVSWSLYGWFLAFVLFKLLAD